MSTRQRSSADQLEAIAQYLIRTPGQFILGAPVGSTMKWRAEFLPDGNKRNNPVGLGGSPGLAVENLLRFIEGEEALPG